MNLLCKVPIVLDPKTVPYYIDMRSSAPRSPVSPEGVLVQGHKSVDVERWKGMHAGEDLLGIRRSQQRRAINVVHAPKYNAYHGPVRESRLHGPVRTALQVREGTVSVMDL